MPVYVYLWVSDDDLRYTKVQIQFCDCAFVERTDGISVGARYIYMYGTEADLALS